MPDAHDRSSFAVVHPSARCLQAGAQLLFKASRDGQYSADLIGKCVGKSNTLVIVSSKHASTCPHSRHSRRTESRLTGRCSLLSGCLFPLDGCPLCRSRYARSPSHAASLDERACDSPGCTSLTSCAIGDCVHARVSLQVADTGYVFGAYVACAWSAIGDHPVPDPSGRSFLFSLVNKENKAVKLTLHDKDHVLQVTADKSIRFGGIKMEGGKQVSWSNFILMFNGRPANDAHGNVANDTVIANCAFQPMGVTICDDTYLAGSDYFAAEETEVYQLAPPPALAPAPAAAIAAPAAVAKPRAIHHS